MNNENFSEKARGFLAALAPVVTIGAILVGVLLIAYAAISVFDLFHTFIKVDVPNAALASVASVGVCVVLLGLTVTSHKTTIRGMGGILLLAWGLLVLTLVGLSGVLRGGLLAVPQSIAEIGRVVAALLPALALVPAMCIPLAAREDDTPYPSAAAAAAHYVAFIVKAVAIGASSFAAAYFGLGRGVPVEVAILCGLLLEGAVLWSYLALIKARQRGDRFDVVMWTLCLVLFGAFIALVSVETISTLAKIEVALLAPLRDAGAVLFTSATGLVVVLTVLTHILTKAIDIPAKAADDAITIRKPVAGRIAGAIRGTREGLREIGAAIRDDKHEALPAPSGAKVFANDEGAVEGIVTTEAHDESGGDGARPRPKSGRSKGA